MSTIDPATLRQAAAEMADWLEGRRFGVTMLAGQSEHDALIATMAWTEGYRRAIHELRWAAQEPVDAFDDHREDER